MLLHELGDIVAVSRVDIFPHSEIDTVVAGFFGDREDQIETVAVERIATEEDLRSWMSSECGEIDRTVIGFMGFAYHL